MNNKSLFYLFKNKKYRQIVFKNNLTVYSAHSVQYIDMFYIGNYLQITILHIGTNKVA